MVLSNLVVPGRLLQTLPPKGSLHPRLELTVGEDAGRIRRREPEKRLLLAPPLVVLDRKSVV